MFRWWLVAAVLLVCVAGCESAPPDPDEGAASAPAALAVDPAAFSAQRAWQHLEELSAIGPRQTGTRGAARARKYLRQQLEEVGASVQEITVRLPAPRDGVPLDAVYLVGLLPGESDDRFLLAASYDTRAIPGIDFVGANASASGPAVVLELARALSKRQRPYSMMFALLDGDALPSAKPDIGFPGSRAFAMGLAEADRGFSAIRLAVLFQQVGDSDLSIARDLRSHHIYREFFWEAAAVLGEGHGMHFPADARPESVEGGHLEFIEQGLPRTVVISDPRFGGSDVPGRFAATEEDTAQRCSADSLEVVGDVALEALDRIADRLARIDRFRRSPLSDPLSESPLSDRQVPVAGSNSSE